MKTSKSDNTKQIIIEKTATVFNTKGYAGNSINDLMQATGRSQGCTMTILETGMKIALRVFDFNFGRVTQHMKIEYCPQTILSKGY